MTTVAPGHTPASAHTVHVVLSAARQLAFHQMRRLLNRPRDLPSRAQCPRGERGASAAIIVLFTVAFLSVAGLVIDGGYALGAKREAMNNAEQAARAGADALTPSALRDGTIAVDPARATEAARAYLSSVGASGAVDVAGGRVSVMVSGNQPTTILSALGVGSLPFKATATALSIDEDTT